VLQIAVAVMAVPMAVVNGFMRSSFGAEGKNDDVSWTECLFTPQKISEYTRVYVSRDVYLKE
jgi:hypothetical protein